MQITEFIEIVFPKLKQDQAISYEMYKGIDLKKTAHKVDNRGNPLEDHKTYKVPVPVEIKVDHKRKMKLAFLRGGKNAVRKYLTKYVDSSNLDKIMSVL